MDVIILLRVNDRHDSAAERTERHKSLLSVGNAIIFVGKRDAIENLFGIDKVETMLLEIGLTLSLVPVDHKAIVYTIRIFVNFSRSRGLTSTPTGARPRRLHVARRSPRVRMGRAVRHHAPHFVCKAPRLGERVASPHPPVVQHDARPRAKAQVAVP
jgi:hypothetical protein